MMDAKGPRLHIKKDMLHIRQAWRVRLDNCSMSTSSEVETSGQVFNGQQHTFLIHVHLKLPSGCTLLALAVLPASVVGRSGLVGVDGGQSSVESSWVDSSRYCMPWSGCSA